MKITETLNISQKTVSRHRENIMRKLNLHSRADREVRHPQRIIQAWKNVRQLQPGSC
jgi:DNA-binding NarL/FixJ family response regulator